jgi:hypothetical protein
VSLVCCAPGGPVNVDEDALRRAPVNGTPAGPAGEIPDHLVNPEIAAHKEAAS